MRTAASNTDTLVSKSSSQNSSNTLQSQMGTMVINESDGDDEDDVDAPADDDDDGTMKSKWLVGFLVVLMVCWDQMG